MILKSALTLALCSTLWGQGVITTLAGTDSYFPGRTVPAVQAPLGEVSGLAIDGSDNVYFCDRRNQIVARVSQEGVLTVVAGNGLAGFSGDGGQALNASLNDPTAVAVDAKGVLYIADLENARIRRVGTDGVITTIAGGGSVAGVAADGIRALDAKLGQPFGVAVDAGGTVYFSDIRNNLIRRVDGAGILAVIAGNGKLGFSPDGSNAKSGPLSGPTHLAFDPSGNVVFADLRNQRIRRISADGTLSTLAGSGTSGYQADERLGTNSDLNNPAGVAYDRSGNLLIADTGNARVRRVDPDGVLRTIAGKGTLTIEGDGGTATQAGVLLPTALATDSSGVIYISAAATGRIRRVSPDGVIGNFAGLGTFTSPPDGAPGTSGSLALSIDAPCGQLSSYPSLAIDHDGGLLFVEPGTNRVRRLTPSGQIQTIAGNGSLGLSGDNGPATLAQLARPIAIAVGPQGVFIFDANNSQIRIVDSQGIIRRGLQLSDLGELGLYNVKTGDTLKATDLIRFGSMAVDKQGTIYLSTPGGGVMRIPVGAPPSQVAPDVLKDKVSLFDNDKLLILAQYLLAVDKAGTLYAADTASKKVYRVDQSNTAVLIAGDGSFTFRGDGLPATSTGLGFISSIAVDDTGNLYIADWGNHAVRKVSPDGIITTVAGKGPGFCGNSGDGLLATQASIDPRAVAVDAKGELYMISGDRIRAVLPTLPGFSVSTDSLAFSGFSGGPPSQTANVNVTSDVPGVPFNITVEPDSALAWLKIAPTEGRTPRIATVYADPGDLRPGAYSATIHVQAQNAAPSERQIKIAFTVGPVQPPSLQVNRDSLSFQFPRNGTKSTQALRVSNVGGGTVTIAVVADTKSGGAWLSVSPLSGDVTPRSPLDLMVMADPSKLPAGTYVGALTISGGPSTVTVPVTMLVSDRDQAMSLTQSGLSFTAVAGGGVVPPQTFGVANVGTGAMPWMESVCTQPVGGGWLAASPDSAVSQAGSTVPGVQVSVNPAGLAPGKYYGSVQIDAGSAPNAPQVVTTFLEVLKPGSNPGAVIQPSQLSAQAVLGGLTPGSQDLLVYDLTSSPVSYHAQVVTSDGANWLRILPENGTIQPDQPLRVAVQPLLNGIVLAGPGSPIGDLPAGEYQATITFQFSDGNVGSVTVKYTVGDAGSVTKSGALPRSASGLRAVEGCSPDHLIPSLRAIGQSFNLSAGWPSALEVEVKDNCGSPLNSGAVLASFSNGDDPIALQPLLDGRWQGTWNTRGLTRDVKVSVKAQSADSQLQGVADASAQIAGAQDPPSFSVSGVVSAATPAPFTALAPRAIIKINGRNLASGPDKATTGPLPKILSGTQVFMTGRMLPLESVSAEQITAIVPEDLPVNINHQMYVRRGATSSVGVYVNMAASQPALFQTSQGLAMLTATRTTADGSRTFQPTAQDPVKAGDALVFLVSGLGPIEGSLLAGNSTPASPAVPTKSSPKLRIGGAEAGVVFAGLVPGLIGVYQIQATMPDGIAGPSAPVTVETEGQISPAVALLVQ